MKRHLVALFLALGFALTSISASAAAVDRETPHAKGPSFAEKGRILFTALHSKKSTADPLAFLNKMTCTANCAGGGRTTCSGEICVAIGGVGVGCGDVATDENDVIITCN